MRSTSSPQTVKESAPVGIMKLPSVARPPAAPPLVHVVSSSRLAIFSGISYPTYTLLSWRRSTVATVGSPQLGQRLLARRDVVERRPLWGPGHAFRSVWPPIPVSDAPL